ncbi:MULTISPECIES: hypothetical protein [unclassified Marinobacter]|uniref:hypothetical protein n=1 Tax=unclassified Marinobacter TaxID=83889 RepID=UPI001267875B|nr:MULTISPECIES: hypothetical protein [unclassified Marinobacter]QFS89031.1 hypothetical protein FIV08_19480 [Marinobacter sp. THAF197a]QFT52816.1 hypothetical protein FIU96_19385 [Marinobacter sp. THAF39]
MMPIVDLLDYYGPLHDDVERCLVGIEIGEDTEYWKRSYLRCLCTFVEARVYLLKLELKTNDHLIDHSELSPQVLAFLDGNEWSVGNNGEIKARMKIVSPVDELKAVIKILGSFYPKLLWDFGSQRWSRVKKLYKSRNGLVHPKKPDDLSIADKEIEDFELFRKDFNTWSASIYCEAWGEPESGS